MLCRLWRECCHDNVEVAFCMELFTKGVLYRFGHVKCDVSLVVHVCLHGEDPLLTMSKVISKGSQGAWQANSLDGIGCLHLEGEYAHCHPPLKPSILGPLWCHTALISQVGLKRCCYGTSEALVCFPLELWYLCPGCLDLAEASECSSKEEVVASFGAILWCFQACGERLRNYCLSEERNGRGGACCIYPSPGWAWTNTLIIWMRSWHELVMSKLLSGPRSVVKAWIPWVFTIWNDQGFKCCSIVMECWSLVKPGLLADRVLSLACPLCSCCTCPSKVRNKWNIQQFMGKLPRPEIARWNWIRFVKVWGTPFSERETIYERYR